MAGEAPAWATVPTQAPAWASAPAAPPPPDVPTKPRGDPTGHVALGEAVLNMATGAIAKPISDVAGLTALAKEIISPTPGGGDPAGFKRQVQEDLTYQPRTKWGENASKYNPIALLGLGVDKVGGAAERIIAPPDAGMVRQGIGAGVHEAINQAPGILGAKYGQRAAEGTGEAVQGASRDLMQSALKPPIKALQRGDAGRAIDTMMDQGINVSKGGVTKLRERISVLNDEIDQRVASSKLSVNKHAVAANLKDTLADFQRQVDAESDVASIQKVYDHFIDHPLSDKTRRTIPVPLAQEMKRGTYKQISSKYGELGAADVEAQKALARGLKEEIAKAIPEVRPLNAEESKLLTALPLVERRVLMSANKNPAGLGILTTSPEKFAAWMADRSDLFKSLVARMLYKAGGATKASGPALAAGGVMTGQAAGRVQSPPEQP